jgi:hypothetical protein
LLRAVPILGVHARVEDGRHVVGFAVLEAGRVIARSSLSGSSNHPARALSELYRQAHDLIGSHGPAALALLRSETFRQPATLAVARQADGAVLAAAGHRDCRLVEWRTIGALRKPLGLEGKGRNPETIDEAAAMIADLDGAGSEVVYAAAAALATSRSLDA